MTQEEKAKAYDDAIEKAKDMLFYKEVRKEDMEYLFPKLKESEDEDKIMKELIYNIIVLNDNTPSSKEIFSIYGKTKEDALTWLEKQGEQKLVDKIQLGKKYRCIASPRYSTFMKGCIYQPEDKFLCSLMNFCSDCFEPIEDVKQNSADKVEPKFKVGDWFVSNKNVFLIKSINNGYCKLEDIKGRSFSPCLLPTEGDYHFWTIEDAKDGDVLAYPDGSITLFKCMTENLYTAHVLWVDGHIELNNSCAIFNVHPATKEQRDFLFKKMKEAGYKWNNKKLWKDY